MALFGIPGQRTAKTTLVGLCAVALVILAGCAQPGLAEPTATPIATPHILTVALQESLAPMQPGISVCAHQLPGAGIVLTWFAGEFAAQSTDVILSWGLPYSDGFTAYPLVYENLVFILHPENQEESLNLEQTLAFYTTANPIWPETNRPVRVFMLPQSETASQMILRNQPGTSLRGVIVPSFEAMIAAVLAEPDAVGYLPAAWESPGVRTFRPPQEAGDIVYALVQGEPTEFERDFIHCLQTGTGQEILLNEYAPVP